MRSLIIIRQSIRMSFQNIRTNKLRSFLTMLGIMIGVASVIGLVTIVQGVTGSILEQFSGLGAGTLSVTARGTALKRGLTQSDLDLLAKVDGVSGVAPSASFTTSAVFNGEVFDTVNVNGRDLTYFIRNKDIVTSGRAFTGAETDGDSNVCVVDVNFVKKVLNGNSPLGTEFVLNGARYIVIGVQGNDNSLMGGFSDNSGVDGTITVPYRNVLKMTSQTNVTSVDVYYYDNYDPSEVEKSLRTALSNIYNGAENSFSVMNLTSLMDVMGNIQGMLTTMLGGIASIALLVGGIGIMNMMLVSVSERTREIGLRKALGAEPFRIQLQFLIESVCLSLIGGFIGIILGLLIAYAGARAMDSAFRISYSAIALGAGFSAAVGIIFGWMPARRASQLNPIDALRSE